MWMTALSILAIAATLSGCSGDEVSRDRDECLDIALAQEKDISDLTLELKSANAGSGYWQGLYRQAALLNSQAQGRQRLAEGRQMVADSRADRLRSEVGVEAARNRSSAMQDFFRQQEIDRLERRLEEVEAR